MSFEPKVIKKIQVYPNTTFQQLRTDPTVQDLNNDLMKDASLQGLKNYCNLVLKKQLEFDDQNLAIEMIDVFKNIDDLLDLVQIGKPQKKSRKLHIYSICPEEVSLQVIKEKFTLMVTKQMLFPQLIHFITLNVANLEGKLQLCNLQLLDDMADVIIESGPHGKYSADYRYVNMWSITDLLSELFRQLTKAIETENDEIKEELWFSFTRIQTQFKLKELYRASYYYKIGQVDKEIINNIVILNKFVEKQNFQFSSQTQVNSREMMIRKIRRSVQVQLYQYCQQKRIAVPEMLWNLAFKSRKEIYHRQPICTLNFPIIMFRKFMQIPDLAPYCKKLCINILLSEGLSLCIALAYHKYLQPQLDKLYSFYELAPLVLQGMRDIKDSIFQDGKYLKFLKVVIQDKQYQNFLQHILKIKELSQFEIASITERRNPFISEFLQLALSLQQSIHSYQLNSIVKEIPYQIRLPFDRTIKITMKKHKMTLKEATQYIKLVIFDLNQAGIPLFEIIYFITFGSKNEFVFTHEINSSLSAQFFIMPHIQNYIEQLYGVNIIVQWVTQKQCEIEYFPLANLDLRLVWNEESLITNQLKIIYSRIKNQKDNYIWAQQYLKKQISYLLQSNSENEKNKIKILLEKINSEL